jgi:outer membrane immunogenic protein
MKHITTILLATVAAAGLMSSAYAADLIIEEPAEVGVVDVSGSWDGAFIGAFVGAGWGLADHTAAGGVGPLPVGGNDVDLSGWLLGVDVGFNATVGSGIVLGVVGDIAWSNISGEIDGTLFDGTTHTIDWMGSLRGRVGFDGGAFLPYLTGGLAFAHAERDSPLGPQPNVADATHIGWTVGAGVEFAVSEELSIDLLYRYSDYGAQTYDFPSGTDPEIDLTAHTIQAGLHWNF